MTTSKVCEAAQVKHPCAPNTTSPTSKRRHNGTRTLINAHGRNHTLMHARNLAHSQGRGNTQALDVPETKLKSGGSNLFANFAMDRHRRHHIRSIPCFVPGTPGYQLHPLPQALARNAIVPLPSPPNHRVAKTGQQPFQVRNPQEETRKRGKRGKRDKQNCRVATTQPMRSGRNKLSVARSLTRRKGT